MPNWHSPSSRSCTRARSTEQFWFDWRGGLLSSLRAVQSPVASAYATEAFAPVRAALEAYEAALSVNLDHPYFAHHPRTMLIDEMEALWAPIAERDDWSAFHAVLAEIEQMRQAYAGDMKSEIRPGSSSVEPRRRRRDRRGAGLAQRQRFAASCRAAALRPARYAHYVTRRRPATAPAPHRRRGHAPAAVATCRRRLLYLPASSRAEIQAASRVASAATMSKPTILLSPSTRDATLTLSPMAE